MSEKNVNLTIEQLATAAGRKFRRDIAKQRRLISNLNADLAKHGDPELWKRYGDLLLASVTTAVRDGARVIVADYFDEASPLIEIEGDATQTIAEIAENYFRRYVKARNGIGIIRERLAAAERAIETNEQMLAKIEAAVEAEDTSVLSTLVGPLPKQAPPSRKKKVEAQFKGVRRFISSDDLEILVGKKAADNDFLTFRIARSLDVWLHAADYPGSHVVIRLGGRKEAPQTTLIQAAELAAFYSDARGQSKAGVRYTQRKFVNKPRKSAPGSVSLSSFRTMLVEPKVSDQLRRPD